MTREEALWGSVMCLEIFIHVDRGAGGEMRGGLLAVGRAVDDIESSTMYLVSKAQPCECFFSMGSLFL